MNEKNRHKTYRRAVGKVRKQFPNPPEPEMNVASTTDCTGLIPNSAVSEAELDEYEELKPYRMGE